MVGTEAAEAEAEVEAAGVSGNAGSPAVFTYPCVGARAQGSGNGCGLCACV